MLVVDVLFSLLSSGRMGYLKPKALSRLAASFVAIGLIALPAADAAAQASSQTSAQSVEDALGLHLAYVKTGNSRIDTLSEAAMKTLVKELTNRTTIEPALSAVTKNLDIPQIGPVPEDHVLTKSFYLLQTFAGRWSNGTVWVDKDRNGTARESGPSSCCRSC